MPLSPPSFREDYSHGESPETRLMALSRDEKAKNSIGSPDETIHLHGENETDVKPLVQFGSDKQQEGEKDPFVTPCKTSKSGLSPTASAFNPILLGTDAVQYPERPVPINTLSQEMGMSRMLKILSEEAVTPQQISTWIQSLELNSKIFHGSKRMIESTGGVERIFFEDIRDACIFHSEASVSKPGWRVIYDNSAHSHLVTKDSAQLIVAATLSPCLLTSPERFFSQVMAKLQAYGEIFAFTKRASFPCGSFKGIIEYCNISAADLALVEEQHSDGESDIHITLTAYQEEHTATNSYSGKLHENTLGPVNVNGDWEYGFTNSKQSTISSHNSCLSPAVAMYPVIAQSPYTPNFPYLVNSFITNGPGTEAALLSTPISPSYQRVSAAYRKPPSPALTVHNGYSPSRSTSAYGRLDRRQHAARVNRNSFQNPNSHHNHVDVHRIREGIDVRTTIMLRNIPNKVDQAMLKRIVDESSWGKYDFMYLRIDFANDCNVGYAFINFVDPLDIIDFVEARGNQRWNCFKSDKVAEVSYATIQGKDCLVQKFRNSSVMLEAAHYRPKLYFTSNGPLPEMAGQEEQFPEPDNQSKMKRSCENAEHVGLFTPNAGQHFRDEQRRRRSQYDRGTRLAALEEYDLEAIQHLYV